MGLFSCDADVWRTASCLLLCSVASWHHSPSINVITCIYFPSSCKAAPCNFSSKRKQQQTKKKLLLKQPMFFSLFSIEFTEHQVVLVTSKDENRPSLQGALEGIVREWVRVSIYRLSTSLSVSSCLLTLSQFLLLCQSDSVHFRLCFVPAHFPASSQCFKVTQTFHWGRSAFDWAGQSMSSRDKSSGKW